MHDYNEYWVKLVKNMLFWVVIFVMGLYFTSPAQASDEVLTMSVVESIPFYGKNRQYTKECFGKEPHECHYIPAKAESFLTTFQNGHHQIKIATQVQFPHDVWFDVTRNCDTGKCYYHKAVPSKYQSPESLAIEEILAKEQIRYLSKPNALP